MANNAVQEPVQVSSFPLPPSQYFSLYTDENIKKNKAPKPPPPNTEGSSYSMFGNQFSNDETIIRPLEAQGIKRLYPQHFDRKKELKKLNHSLLANFMDLIDLLVNSNKPIEKIDDLTLLFVHIHHLLNEYRPHQARETLRVMMELQKRQRLETVKRFNFHLETVKEIVKNAFSSLPEDLEAVNLNKELMNYYKSINDNNSDQEIADQLLSEIIEANLE